MKSFLVLVLVTTLVSAVLACGDDEENKATVTPGRSPTSAPTASQAPAPTAVATASPSPSGGITPAGTPVSACQPLGTATPSPDQVQVDAPAPGARVTSPVTVSGRIAAFEATFRVRIFDATGNMLADQQAMSAEGQTLSPFSASVPFSVSAPTVGCIWVFELSARDGSPINVYQIPVTLAP